MTGQEREVVDVKTKTAGLGAKALLGPNGILLDSGLFPQCFGHHRGLL